MPRWVLMPGDPGGVPFLRPCGGPVYAVVSHKELREKGWPYVPRGNIHGSRRDALTAISDAIANGHARKGQLRVMRATMDCTTQGRFR